MKRLARCVPLLAVLVFAVTGAVAEAAQGGADVVTTTVSFTMTSASCANLPAGTTITGSGSQRSVTTTRTDASGVTRIVNATHAHGTASDQDGNSYVFNYANEFRISNTLAQPDLFSGLMTDSFTLAGPGPAKLQNGFVANLTAPADFSTASWDVIQSRGDPISFESGPIVSHCDPL
jgi:hypothetical protein